jgi:site-specific DNA recombinase
MFIGEISMKVAAIYSRKSKITEKGDSIENQINICKNYLKNIGIEAYIIYEDEGFSGKNTQRPEFQKMLHDAENKKFDVLICYKLDRVSRNVSDFSSFIEALDKYGIGFISITERFDTTSPMGRAMMYISSVFSQLERETIAQRVKDNMIELAKDGKWLGGMTPTGFESRKVTFTDENHKTRSYHELTPVEDELKLVKLIYKKYIETESLYQVMKYLLVNNYKTKLNTDWSRSKISSILRHPVYVKASWEVINYLNSKSIITIGEPDGIHGMLFYRRRKGKSGYNDMDLWMAVVSKHEGIIDGQEWLKAQSILDKNASNRFTVGENRIALLTGLIKCKHCDSNMRVQYGKLLKSTGQKQFFYVCSLKYDSGCTRCNNSNLEGPTIEKVIVNKLKEMSVDKGMLVSKFNEYKKELANSSINNEYKNINDQLRQINSSINNVVKTITLTENEDTSKILVNRLNELTSEKETLEIRLKDIDKVQSDIKEDKKNIDAIIKSLSSFASLIDICDLREKKELLRGLVEKIYWDGEKRNVDLVLWGAGE